MIQEWEPVTIGNVTVVHPGEAPPRGKWPEGYPGPGYEADVIYKDRKYHYKFQKGDLKVEVTYPDGSTYQHKSPNAASDSMVLFDRGLPLDASAYVKKHKHRLSYPATKALKLRDFSPHFLNLDIKRDEITPERIEDCAEGSFVELELGRKKLLFVKCPDTWVASASWDGAELQDRIPMAPYSVFEYLNRTKAENGTIRTRFL